MNTDQLDKLSKAAHDLIQQASRERDEARAALAECQKHAAAMREAIKFYAGEDHPSLRSNAGKDFVRLRWRPGTEQPPDDVWILSKDDGHTTTETLALTWTDAYVSENHKWPKNRSWLLSSELLGGRGQKH